MSNYTNCRDCIYLHKKERRYTCRYKGVPFNEVSFIGNCDYFLIKPIKVDGRIVKCKRCGYTWVYRGNGHRTACGECGGHIQFNYKYPRDWREKSYGD